MKVRITKWVLSKRELDKLRKQKGTIDLRGKSNLEKRLEAKEKKEFFRQLKLILIWLIILSLLGWLQIKVYWDIQTTETKQIDPLKQVLQDNPEIEDEILDKEAPILTTDEVLEKRDFNINKLAYAVAYHETKNCQLWYGKKYNNCFWIKQNRTARCDKVGRNKMCIYKTPEDSYKAFKIIWSKWYWWLPTIEMAKRWSGNDRAKEWRRNVLYIYNKDLW